MFPFTDHDDEDAIDFSTLISRVPAESEAVAQAVQPNERDDERLPRETPPRRAGRRVGVKSWTTLPAKSSGAVRYCILAPHTAAL